MRKYTIITLVVVGMLHILLFGGTLTICTTAKHCSHNF